MAQLELRRWTRYGHDRLYVTTASGTKVGWIDLRTQQRKLHLPGMRPDFDAAVNRWRAEHLRPDGIATFPPTNLRSPRRRSLRVELNEDLARRRPGHNATAIADSLRPKARSTRVLAWLVRWHTPDQSWGVGAAGERVVGAKLNTLSRRGWKVLHGVTFGSGGDVDHLLIGPFGVFTVNTKNHPRGVVRVGRAVVFVRGHPTSYVGKAHWEARRVQRALTAAWDRPVHVGPLLVIHGHRRLSGWLRSCPRGVRVLPSWIVTWWFRLPGRANLSPADINALHELARRPATWTTV